MKKTIVSFVFVGMFFMNTDVCGLDISETGFKQSASGSTEAEYIAEAHAVGMGGIRFKRSASGSDETDARPFVEYVAEADTAGQNYGQLMRIIGGENFKGNYATAFCENLLTAVSLTEELPDDDRYKLLGLCWCNVTPWFIWRRQIDGDDTVSPGRDYCDLLDRLIDNYKKIRYGECETYAEWVSDILYSTAFHAYDAFSKASDEPLNNHFRGCYVLSLFRGQKESYEKARNYKLSSPPRIEERGSSGRLLPYWIPGPRFATLMSDPESD